MPRPIRFSSPYTTYHVILTFNNSDFMFNKPSHFSLFLAVISLYKQKFNFKIFGYCVMNSHIHLIIQTPLNPKFTISKIIHAITWRIAFTYNRRHNRKGHLFNNRFKSTIIQDDIYSMQVLKYISQNPVRAGIVKRPSEWKWSSYNFYAYGKYDLVLDILPGFEALSAEKKARSFMFREMVESVIMPKNTAFTKSYVIGEEEFCKRILRLAGLLKEPPT